MITRIWQGWTTPDNAERYDTLLTQEIIPTVQAKQIEGLQSIEVLRRHAGDEVEFMTIYRFATLDAVKAMAGDDVEQAFVPDKARQVLKRFEPCARHFDHRLCVGA